MQISISRKQLAVVIGSIIIAVTLFGGYKAQEAWNATQANVARLEANVAAQTERGDTIEVKLADETKVAEASATELAALKTQYGVALTDKDKATADAAAQKKAASASAAEANKQKAVATEANGNLAVCGENVNAMVKITSTLDTQKGYYRTAGQYIADSFIQFNNENYDAATQDINYATNNVNAAEALDSTVTYWIGQIK